MKSLFASVLLLGHQSTPAHSSAVQSIRQMSKTDFCEIRVCAKRAVELV